LRGGYGLGQAIFVDPTVLLLPGVTCALYDIGEVVRHAGYLVDDPRRAFPAWILEPQVLRAIVEKHRERIEHLAASKGVPRDLHQLWVEQHVTRSIVASPEFSEYSARYTLEPRLFLDALVKQFGPALSLRAFLERQGSFESEVLVPRAIEPRYLLGYRKGAVWHSWNSPTSPEVAERLQALVTLCTSRTAS